MVLMYWLVTDTRPWCTSKLYRPYRHLVCVLSETPRSSSHLNRATRDEVSVLSPYRLNTLTNFFYQHLLDGEDKTVFTPAAGHKQKKVRVRRLRLQDLPSDLRRLTENSTNGDISAFHQFMNATTNRYGECSDYVLLPSSEFRRFEWKEGEVVVLSATAVKEKSRAEEIEGEGGRGRERGELPSSIAGDTQPKVWNFGLTMCGLSFFTSARIRKGFFVGGRCAWACNDREDVAKSVGIETLDVREDLSCILLSPNQIPMHPIASYRMGRFSY